MVSIHKTKNVLLQAVGSLQIKKILFLKEQSKYLALQTGKL